MSDKCTDTGSSEFIVWISTHVAIISLIMFCGVVGNGLVLIIYGRDKKQSGAVYIIALAVIDLFSCVCLLPQIPLYEMSLDCNYELALDVIGSEGIVQGMATLFVQVTMALDQFVAVFYPFKHAKLRGTLNKIMVVAFLVVASTLSVMPFALPEFRIKQGSKRNVYLLLIASVFSIGLLVLLSAYSAVALKLYRQGRSVGPQLGRTKSGAVRPSSAVGVVHNPEITEKVAQSKRAMHIQALKIYTSIFLAFIAAYLMFMVSIFSLSVWPGYGYYVNHTVNPVIYYCFVEKFRNNVNGYWHRLSCRCFV